MMSNLEMIEKITEYLLQEIEPDAILLFGSVVNGYFRDESDVDIAFLSEKELSEYEVLMIAQHLASKIGLDVDLVDLKKASTVFKAEIIGKGKCIYIGDELKYADFRIRSLKEYALLNEERKPILDAIAKRGAVYG